MSYSETDLRAATSAGVISAPDLERLLAFLSQGVPGKALAAKFDVAHLLWYAGALIVIAAMGLFSTLAFAQMGGKALTACAAVSAVAFWFAGDRLWRNGLRVPGGLLITIAVSMAPLVVYGIQNDLGWWGRFGKPGTAQDFDVWIKGSRIFMEIATVLAGTIALRFYRMPFIVAIIAVALWFMSMTLAQWLIDALHMHSICTELGLICWVSAWFGLGMLVVAWIVGYHSRNGSFAFWLHLFGLMAFWGGITSYYGPTGVLYCLLNVGLLLIAVVIMQRVYAVFGAFGIALYLVHLTSDVFRNSLLFPFALSLIGIAVVAIGLLYHRRQDAIAAWLTANLPRPLLRLRPQQA
jgi:hypothetical protein